MQDLLRAPRQLYGRKQDTNVCSESFARSREGSKEVLLISGDPGIGKTAIAKQLRHKVISQGAQFISGKCDKQQKDIPYACLLQALEQRIEQLLSKSKTEQSYWGKKILDAVRPNGQVLVELIPSLERIIKRQAAVPSLQPAKTKNRFNLVLRQFIQVFCQPGNPLVIFLDDLQWVDIDSIDLICSLLTDLESNYLLLVGAYRNAEVDSEHPLTKMIELIQGVHVQQVQLLPLSGKQLEQCIADMLQDWTEKPKPLANIMLEQTGGNPLLLGQYLNTLYLERQLFQSSNGEWRWEIETAEGQTVIELVSRNLNKLDPQTQHIIKRAACFGKQVTVRVLAIINEKSISQTLRQLEKALKSQLICIERKPDLIIHFYHDRIQQAVYDMIPETTREAMHLASGKLLQSINGDLFSIVNQLNLGSNLISDRSEQKELALLNLKATRKAKAIAAFESASIYINQAVNLLRENTWDSQVIALEIHQELIEIESLNKNFEQAHEIANAALEVHSNTLLEKVSIYQLKIHTYIAQSYFSEAIELGLNVLSMLEVNLKEEVPKDLSIEVLESLPETTDKEKLAALKALTTISDFCLFVDPDQFPSMLITEMHLLWEYGNSELSACVCIDYAFLLCASGEIEAGSLYGELALRLLNRPGLKKFHCKVTNIYHCGISHWRRNIRETLPHLKQAINSGIEHGDLEFAGHAMLNYCTHSVFAGITLEEIEKRYRECKKLFSKFSLDFHENINRIFNQFIILLKEKPDSINLKGNIFDAGQELPEMHSQNDTFGMFLTYLAEGILSYLFCDYSQAVEHFRMATEYAEVMGGFAAPTQMNFYYALALAAYYPSAKEKEKLGILEQIHAQADCLSKWAKHGSVNFQHKYDLIQAELSNIQGLNDMSISLYDKAIQGAKNSGYLHEEALSNELAGKFYIKIEKQELAKNYLLKAYEKNYEWGALAISQRIKESYECLNCLDLSADFSQTLCEKLMAGISHNLDKAIQRAGANISYNQRSQELEVTVKRESRADLIRPYLRSLREQMPKNIKVSITLKVTHD